MDRIFLSEPCHAHSLIMTSKAISTTVLGSQCSRTGIIWPWSRPKNSPRASLIGRVPWPCETMFWTCDKVSSESLRTHKNAQNGQSRVEGCRMLQKEVEFCHDLPKNPKTWGIPRRSPKVASDCQCKFDFDLPWDTGVPFSDTNRPRARRIL